MQNISLQPFCLFPWFPGERSQKESHEETLGCSRVSHQSLVSFTTLLFQKLVKVKAFKSLTRENPGCQSVSGFWSLDIKTPVVSTLNSIFCHIHFAGSWIPNLIADNLVFNALKLLCCSVHESDRMQVPWQGKLKGNRCSMEHTEALQKFLQDVSALRSLRNTPVSPTNSQWRALQRSDLHNSSIRAVSESLSKHKTEAGAV